MSKHLVEVKVWGKYACFTRPENKVERLSYPIITPSAAVGVLESIYWKPEFRWEITEIGVLPHPNRNGLVDWENYMPITLNELATDGQIHPQDGYNLEQHRVQRTCLVLRWPCYLIRARACILGGTTNAMAIQRQFTDRAKTGQCFHQPSLGLREFTAYFAEPEEMDRSYIDHPETHGIHQQVTRDDLGMILHSYVFSPKTRRVEYQFVPLKIERNKFTVGVPEVVQ
jgi:CRISPR-associated protein Cas5d